ncbi:MAG: dihydrodipicolinate synthase family protein [Pirellula sp.]
MSVDLARQAFLRGLFPNGVPRLWCPALTHFRAAKCPALERIQSHLSTIAPFVGGLLVPGSTGEGWEMGDADIREVLTHVLDASDRFGLRVLIGVLKTNLDEMLDCIQSMNDLRGHPAVVGVTVCPPKGNGLSQDEIKSSLAKVLELGWPTALYQLPQITQNEMSPEIVAALAADYPNFVLFKDTSGHDHVAKSQFPLGGVFLLRGSEQGGYVAWPKIAGGIYDGFLLSTANVFADQFAQMLQCLDNGQLDRANAISEKLQAIVGRAFALVAEFPIGNAFTNANKVLDHCLAFGSCAITRTPPMLYSGAILPKEYIEQAVDLLTEYSLMPIKGYLE